MKLFHFSTMNIISKVNQLIIIVHSYILYQILSIIVYCKSEVYASDMQQSLVDIDSIFCDGEHILLYG